MKSPFPGMDPFIEPSGLWRDFHNHLIEWIGNRLAESLPERYLVRSDERSYVLLINERGKSRHPFLPDITIKTRRGRKKDTGRGTATLTALASDIEPVPMRAFIQKEHRERFIEILEAGPEQRLVTTLEVLSPSNKQPQSPGWELYLRKRESVLLSPVNLVELDLLRGGQRMPMLDPWPASPYTLLVARAKADVCKVWPAYSLRPLPSISVPLARPDPDIALDLQPLIDAIYERYRYEQSIDYRKPLDPPLDSQEAACLKKQLRGRRAST